jgi:thioredoxin-like negative regulator of GroEL
LADEYHKRFDLVIVDTNAQKPVARDLGVKGLPIGEAVS